VPALVTVSVVVPAGVVVGVGPAGANTGAGGSAVVYQVSCATAGNCAAGGIYDGTDYESRGFVAVERNGVWGKAIEVPGLGALDYGLGVVTSVSCLSPGNCAADGSYSDLDGSQQGFVAVLENGVWHRAIEVPGLGALDKGGYAGVLSAGERHGHWGTTIQMPR
jgi:hypothetical protein